MRRTISSTPPVGCHIKVKRHTMSEYKKKILLGATFAVIVAVGLAIAAISFGPPTGTTNQQTTSEVLGTPSVLIVQLTDPPIVPAGTTSLNLTYSAINVLVSEPGVQTSTSTTTIVSGSSTVTSTITASSTNQNGQVTPQTITLTPKSGSATVDLLKLQNISQTIASSNIPNGSTIYSVSFTVSSMTIEINGVSYPVTLATGGNTLLVTLVNPTALSGTNAVLLDLNPTIISTPSGYQMIPSSIGVIRPHSEVSSQDEKIGSQHQLTNQDQNEIQHAKGQLSASLTALSVSGSTTTLTVQVSNTGSSPVRLVAIGLHGNFTSQSCTTSTSSTTSANDHYHEHPQGCESPNEVVFIPGVAAGTSSSTSTTMSSSSSSITTSSTATTTNSCVAGQMNLVNSGGGRSDDSADGHQLILSPGQCITLTFSGTMSFGQSSNVLVPSTTAGQNYTVHVIASNGAEMSLSCALPLSSTSCMVVSNSQGQDN